MKTAKGFSAALDIREKTYLPETPHGYEFVSNYGRYRLFDANGHMLPSNAVEWTESTLRIAAAKFARTIPENILIQPWCPTGSDIVKWAAFKKVN